MINSDPTTDMTDSVNEQSTTRFDPDLVPTPDGYRPAKKPRAMELGSLDGALGVEPSASSNELESKNNKSVVARNFGLALETADSMLEQKSVDEKMKQADQVDEPMAEFDKPWVDEDDEDLSDLYIPVEGGPAIDPSILDKRKIAKVFQPGLPNMLWCALNSPEADTGSNMLLDLLTAHDRVPPLKMVKKLMDLMKYGPNNMGETVRFKDPHRTELVSQYVYSLLWASRRLVRGDSGALFGPSSWDDIEVLLSQSIVQTKNMISGRRLAQGLQLAARGAKLLSMLFQTELQGYDLYSTVSTALESEALVAMPTVRVVKDNGVLNSLQTAVEKTTKCLVHHSGWIMDSGGIELATTKSTSDESCSLEARACLDDLGSVICAIAWLYCVEERVGMKEQRVALVITDAFLEEMKRSLQNVPEMSTQAEEAFVKKCKLYFVMSLADEFAHPMLMPLAKSIGVDDELALVGFVG